MGQHPSSPSVQIGENTTGMNGTSQKLFVQSDGDSEDSEKEWEDVTGKRTMSLKGKEREVSSVEKREGPVQLLDLPLDILKDILKEVGRLRDAIGETMANFIPGHPYQRPRQPGSGQLHPARCRDTHDIQQIRHSLARFAQQC